MSSDLFVVLVVCCGVGAVASLVVAVCAVLGFVELRASKVSLVTANETLLKVVDGLDLLAKDQAETRRSLTSSAEKVTSAFLEADGSFKAMIDALKDVENLATIKQRVEEISSGLVAAHDKIKSQLHASGTLLGKLHELWELWSKEGTELQQAYGRLARLVEEAIVRDADTRQKLSVQLATLLESEARGRDRRAS